MRRSVLDYNGNTLTKVVGSNTTSYTWDFENRLTSVVLPGSGGTISLAYDPFGRRIKKVTPTTTSIFAYDGDNLVEETNSSGTAVARYSQGLNIDEPLAMLRSSATSFYNADGLGSVTSLGNAAGALAQTYTFDSFGNQTASSGSLTNPFQYTARESDPETGLYYYRARYYDPLASRFPSEDPLGFGGRGVNFYAYVDNRPLDSRDPYGLFAVPPCVRKLLSPYFPKLDFDSVNLHNMVPLPADVVGFTWDNDVFITPSQYDIHSALGIALIGHELTHVQDFQLLGKNGFAALYGINFGINYYFNGNNFDQAYRDVSFERDARAMEAKIHDDLYKKFGLGGDPCPPQTAKGKCSEH